MKRGLLLINLGTPTCPKILGTGNFLREFLSDKRVINLPTIFRYLLVYGYILPFKTQKSCKAYRSIWTQDGSPLLNYSRRLVAQLQKQMGVRWTVSLGMRYGQPSILNAIEALKTCESITVLPLYPQYSSAATGSAIEAVMQCLKNQEWIPALRVIPHFYQDPAYINAQAAQIQADKQDFDFLLFSYHGIPNQQVLCKQHCLTACPAVSEENKRCYRAQCFQTSRLLAQALDLPDTQYATSFQSRFGRAWTAPYTDEELIRLAEKGVKRLKLCCPSFVTDCLETLEEIGIRAKNQWLALGGETLTLVPAMNDSPRWLEAIAQMVNAPTF